MRFIKFILLLAIFGYIFYDFDFSKLNFSKISFFKMFETIFILFIAQLILSIRFMKIIDLSFKASYETIVISNALNMFLPARLGEIVKAVYLKKFYDYEYNKGLASVFIERFFDVIMLFFVILAWGYFYFTDELIKKSILFLGISIFVIIVFFNSKFIQKFIPSFFLKFYLNIKQNLKKFPILIFFSFILWGCYFMSYLSFFNLDFFEILELFIFSTIALSLPLSPAGIGTFEGVIVFYLTQYGITKEDAFLFATIYHFLIFLVDFLMFYILIIFSNKFTFKNLIKKVTK